MHNVNFDDLLDEVLNESAASTLLEEEEDDLEKLYSDKQIEKDLKLEDDDDDDFDDDDDDVDPDDIDDDDMDDDLDSVMDDLGDLTDDDLDQVEDNLKDDDDEEDDDDAEQVRLNPDEEIEADNLMQVAGTASLIRSEMNMDERAEFLESSADLTTAKLEGFINDSVIQEMEEMSKPIDLEETFQEAKIYNKNTVRLNKEARLAQLFAIAVYASARAHNDPEYKKWKKAKKVARYYSANMRRKYKSEATKRMRVLFARLKSSKSPIVKDLGKKVDPHK